MQSNSDKYQVHVDRDLTLKRYDKNSKKAELEILNHLD